MEYKNILSKIVCRICKEQFNQPKALYKHLQQKHDAGPVVKDHRTCSICGVQCTKYDAYKEHMLHIHGLRSEPQKLTFKNLNDFLLWKVELEKKYSCQYILQNAPKLLPTNERKYFYQCDRSGQDRPKSREKKITTITKKSCPSVILVLEGTGILKVEYWDSHVGHPRIFESDHGDELTSAISTLEMMQNMDAQDFEDSLNDNFAYNADFDSSSPLPKSRKKSPRKKGRTTTANVAASQNVIRTFYSPTNSGQTQKKPTSSVLFSLASVACGKINKNIISEKRILNPPGSEINLSKSTTPASLNNIPSKKKSSENDTSVASTSTAGISLASLSAACATTNSSTSSVAGVSSPTASVSVTSSLSNEKTAAPSSVHVKSTCLLSVDDATSSSSVNEATTLPSPARNDSSSPVIDLNAPLPVDDIDTSSPVTEIVINETDSSTSNKTAASSSTTVSIAASSKPSASKRTSSSKKTANISSSASLTKTSSSASIALNSTPGNVKTSSSSVTSSIVSPIPISTVVQSATSLGTNVKNAVAPVLLSNPASLNNQFYILGPAIGTQSSFNTNLSNVILCPAGQSIIAPNTVVNPTVPSSMLKNSDENSRKRKHETESLNQDGPNMKKTCSQEPMKSPIFGSVSTAARILNSIGSNQLVTNYIGSPQSSVTCMNNNANNKLVLSSLPPMSFVNINNQLVPISTTGTPLSVSTAAIPIGQPPVAYNLPMTKNIAGNVVKDSDVKSTESKNDTSPSLKSKSPMSISSLAGTPILKPLQIYSRRLVREGESHPTRTTSATKSNLPVEHNSISNVSTPRKGKAGTPAASLTISPIKTNDQQVSVILSPSIVAKTISSVVKENASSPATSGASFNATNSTLSKVIAVASQIAKTVASGKMLPLSTSYASKAPAKASNNKNTSKSKISGKKPANAHSVGNASAPSIVIPPIPADSEHSRSFVFESAGDVYMLQPVDNDDPKTGDNELSELVKVKNQNVSVQTVPCAKYSYFNNFSKSSLSPEKADLKDDSEILKKVKYYQLEMNYLSSQEECKRLKVELAKAKLKNKELAEKLGIEMQPSDSTNHVENQKESCIQAEELVKAFEKRCESDQDSSVYTLMRTSVLHSLYQDIQELSATNKQQYNELKSYRDHDKFYKFLKQKLEDGEQ